MKRFLPNSKPSGFTLIELLVVITIIAILAVIGIVAYSGVSARARDARRIKEIDAIATAMEKNYVPSTQLYTKLDADDFANGAIPEDAFSGSVKCGPGNALLCEYCGGTDAQTVVNTASLCGSSNAKVSDSVPAAGTTYGVCATLETAAGNLASGKLYCRSSSQ